MHFNKRGYYTDNYYDSIRLFTSNNQELIDFNGDTGNASCYKIWIKKWYRNWKNNIYYIFLYLIIPLKIIISYKINKFKFLYIFLISLIYEIKLVLFYINCAFNLIFNNLIFIESIIL